MATSSFRSTTERTSIRSTGSEWEACRRSRSLGRLASPMAPEPEIVAEYNRNASRGMFVNTSRGSALFPEISLDDLALELFSSSSRNENASDGVAGRKERERRSVHRREEVGRWVSDTASSWKRGRSVSKTREVARSGNSTSGAKSLISTSARSRRRRSLSVVRYQMSDFESELDHSWNSSNAATRARASRSSQMPSISNAVASSNRRMRRSRSRKDFSGLHDGYSTDNPVEDVANDGLYKTVQKEIRCAVEEIHTELNQTMRRNQTAGGSLNNLQLENCSTPQDSSRIGGKYAMKSEQLEKRKDDLLTEMLSEEQQGLEFFKMVDGHPNSRTSTVTQRPSHAWKRSIEGCRMSNGLLEEAERCFEEFLSIVEDTDISSFDGGKSDGSSTLGGETKMTRTTEAYKTYLGSSNSVEMDAIVLPWLQWEVSPNGSRSEKNKVQTPPTPKTLKWDSEKDMFTCNDDPSGHSISSHGSWSPGIFPSPPVRETRLVVKDHVSCFDMFEHLQLQKNEELLFEMYREQNRINLGGLLLCIGGLH